MKVKDLIKELKKYNPQATVEINDPNPKTEGSRPIGYVNSEEGYVDIVMIPTDGPNKK
jgi:hypothetical protein|tara:strand:+ start:467 stop:640 length:174 start_codon:yes stop_codon:yes gene_type:complete